MDEMKQGTQVCHHTIANCRTEEMPNTCAGVLSCRRLPRSPARRAWWAWGVAARSLRLAKADERGKDDDYGRGDEHDRDDHHHLTTTTPKSETTDILIAAEIAGKRWR